MRGNKAEILRRGRRGMRGTLALLCVEFDNDVFHIHVLRNVTGKKVLEELRKEL